MDAINPVQIFNKSYTTDNTCREEADNPTEASECTPEY
jgi:hypothetical protein